jgi:hypothetical protein
MTFFFFSLNEIINTEEDRGASENDEEIEKIKQKLTSQVYLKLSLQTFSSPKRSPVGINNAISELLPPIDPVPLSAAGGSSYAGGGGVAI